jgi:predicted ATP-grasp superfamily ATP-dependent carboligase
MRRAIAADFACVPAVRVVMTLDHRCDAEPGPWTIARIAPGEERNRLARLAAEVDFTASIAPETGGILADRARWIAAAGGRSLGSTPAAIELAGHKLRLAAHLAEQGIATPPCRRVVPAAGLPADFPYPAVLKPIDGAGSVETYWVARPDACPDAARALAVAILQPFISGVPLSASFLVDDQGRARLIGVGRQAIVVREGRFGYRGGTVPAVWDRSNPLPRCAVESVAGLRGFVGVDFIQDQATGRATVLEINPRPTTSYVGLARLLSPGALAGAWLAAVGGRATGDGCDWAGWVHAQTPVTYTTDGSVRRHRARIEGAAE